VSQCHGIWLDKGEFEIITSYLKTELDAMHPREIEKQALADVERVWSGGPESRLDELIDAKAAVSASSTHHLRPSSPIQALRHRDSIHVG